MTEQKDMFDKDTETIFRDAGVSLETPLAKQFYEDIKYTLSEKMAILSVSEGLTYTRIKHYDEQKRAFVDDLKQMLKEHPDELKKD